MDEETQKIITEQIKRLPEDVRKSILSVDYQTKLQEITKRQRLLIDQAGKLEMETTLVMIGLEPLADYIANLQRELGVPVMRAKEIATDVSENIFKPIRESLYAMNQENENESDETGRISIEKNLDTHRSTDSNDININREQILNEIENPSSIGKAPATKNQITTGGSREIETLDETPYQQDIKIKEEIPAPRLNVLETKMAGITITPQQIVEAKPETKLPPVVEKKRPSSGIDPYREAIS